MRNLKQTLQNIEFFESELTNNLIKKNLQVIDYIINDLMTVAKKNSKHQKASDKITETIYHFQPNDFSSHWLWLNNEDVITIHDPDFIVEYFQNLDLDVKVFNDESGLTLTLSWK